MYYKEAYRVFAIHIDDGHIIDDNIESKIYNICSKNDCEVLTRDCKMSNKLLIKVGDMDAHGTLNEIMEVINRYGVL